MRHTYLWEHKKASYTPLLFKGELVAHLNEIDNSANTRMGLPTKQMTKLQSINKAPNVQDRIIWIDPMNNIRHYVEEIVLKELVLCPNQPSKPQ